MSGPLYKIRRSGGMEPTTWISATGINREFDPDENEFIVDEIEMRLCLHHGNFKLLGPADKGTVHPTLNVEPTPEPGPVPVVEEPAPVVEEPGPSEEEENE